MARIVGFNHVSTGYRRTVRHGNVLFLSLADRTRRCVVGRLYARWQFQDYISTRAVQIVQPDLIQAGGIWESRKIAAMAESKSIGAPFYNVLNWNRTPTETLKFALTSRQVWHHIVRLVRSRLRRHSISMQPFQTS